MALIQDGDTDDLILRILFQRTDRVTATDPTPPAATTPRPGGPPPSTTSPRSSPDNRPDSTGADQPTLVQRLTSAEQP
jgi:hypothetical protein